MSDINENDIGAEILHSKKILSSYGTGSLVSHLIDGVINFILFYFYEAEVGLNSWLVALGLVIYALWDGVNDPLVGYITDRPFKFTKKWGRRFPWIILAYVPWLISFLLLFSPPNINAQEQPWIMFGWLVGTLCLYDFLESVVTVNFNALFPDKFRGKSERLKASAFTVYIGFIGVVLGFIIPPMFIIYGNIGTFALVAWVCIAISFVCGVIMIPGVRDDKANVEKYLAKHDKTQQFESFFKVLKQTIKQKSFLVFVIMYILYLSLTHLMTSSLLYFDRYILKSGMLTIITLMLLLGGLVSIPFWLKLNKKFGDNRKTMITGGIVMICSASLFTVITDLTLVIIITFSFGFGVGGFWVMIEPVFSEVIDESIVTYEKRREGIYNGIRNFFAQFGKALQALTLATVHELTGFVEGSDTQTPLALLGIQLHMGLIPATFMAIGIFVFWKFFDITPDKAKQMKLKLIELKL
jgi:GPH family glycoside/pentoside/hexuronide:cation symporter